MGLIVRLRSLTYIKKPIKYLTQNFLPIYCTSRSTHRDPRLDFVKHLRRKEEFVESSQRTFNFNRTTDVEDITVASVIITGKSGVQANCSSTGLLKQLIC